MTTNYQEVDARYIRDMDKAQVDKAIRLNIFLVHNTGKTKEPLREKPKKKNC